jgi:thiol-disulfide isomerase/thioredoxin
MSFFENVGQEKYVIVKFYTKWCGYCKLFSPVYDKFFKKMKKKRKDFIVARIDAEENIEISLEYGIRSYPKVVIFYPGSIELKAYFTYPRTLEKLFDWVDEHAPINGKTKDEEVLNFMEDINTNNSNIYSPDLTQEEEKPRENILDPTNNTKIDQKMELEYLKKSLNETKLRYEKLIEEVQLFKENLNKVQLNLTTSSNNLFFAPDDYFDYTMFALIVFLVIFGIIIARKVYNKIINKN